MKGDEGTGLGLATVYGIVKQSAGHVTVSSELMRGTTFKIYLPRDSDGTAATPSTVTSHTQLRGTETILLVEDEDAVRSLGRTVLEQHGYTVLDAQHGSEALLKCQQYQGVIHLVATDVVMPHMSGRKLVERLLTLRPNIKVLYMSGYTDDAIVRHGVYNAEVPFLRKPYTPDTIAQKVREVLDCPRPNGVKARNAASKSHLFSAPSEH